MKKKIVLRRCLNIASGGVDVIRVMEDRSRSWRRKREKPVCDDGEVEQRYSTVVGSRSESAGMACQ